MNTSIYKNYNNINLYNNRTEDYCYTDEIIKSFILYLQIPKGSFTLDNSIGSNFVDKLRQFTPNKLKDKLLYTLKEEALDFYPINIENVDYTINKQLKSISLFILISANKNIYSASLEVFL